MAFIGHIIYYKFFSPNYLTLSKQVNIIRVYGKYALKQEKIMIMNRLHAIPEKKKRYFQIMKRY